MSAHHVNNSNESLIFDTGYRSIIQEARVDSAERVAQVAFSLGEAAMRFARIERVPRYDEQSRENDAEHSFMLALVATELAATYCPELDSGLVAQFCNVHDLVEIETGDVATYLLDDSGLETKAANEHAALYKVAASLPTYTRELLLRYEQQLEPEARFVRLVDKILPVIVDIVGPGRKVLEEDYGITNRADLDANELRLSNKLRERFPDEKFHFLHEVRDVLANQFSEVFSRTILPQECRITQEIDS